MLDLYATNIHKNRLGFVQETDFSDRILKVHLPCVG